jgi:hypothetical protein
MSNLNLKKNIKSKRREWLRRYIPAEILGTLTSLTAAWITYNSSHSYVAATAAGWVFEGFGFYGYFITTELIAGSKKYSANSFISRVVNAVKSASTNLVVEFLPAEALDNFIIRPFAMFEGPHLIHPYPVGFL